MRNKKSRKSLFNWCIRTLAVSLVPSLLLVSCASDSGDSATPDTTAPTVSFGAPDTTVVGTVAYTLTFSEAVTGVSTNVTLVDSGNNSLPVTTTSTDNIIWTVDPDGDLVTGSYTLTLTAAGIQDSAGNALDNGTALSFSVLDAHSTVLTNLEKDLTADLSATLVKAIIDDIKAATTSLSGEGNGSNTLYNVLLAASGSFVATIENDASLSENTKALATESFFDSFSGMLEAGTLNDASARSVAATNDVLLSFYKALGTTLGTTVSTPVVMEKVMTAIVKSLIKVSGVAVSDVTSYTAGVAENATTAFVNRDDVTDKTPVLGGLSKGVEEGAKQVDPTIVAEINLATAAAMDAGNSAAENPVDISSAKPDGEPPIVAITSPVDGAITNADNTLVTVTFSDSQGEVTSASVNSVVVSSSGSTVSVPLSEGTNTLVASATDDASTPNTGTSASVTVTRDSVAPVVSLSTDATSPYSSTATVVATATATDANPSSGSISIVVNGQTPGPNGEVTLNLNEGPNTIVATATDAAGNSDEKTVSVAVDTADPSIDTLTTDATAPYSDADVVVTVAASDAGSGIDTLTVNGTDATGGPVTITGLAQGANTITVIATDGSGKSTTNTSTVVTVDTLDPSIDNITTDATTPWNDADVVVTVAASDAGSGIATLTVNGTDASGGPVTITGLAQGANTITVVATDVAGKTATNNNTIVNVDTVVPAIGSASVMGDVAGVDNDTHDDDGTITVSLTHSDATSGVAEWGWSTDNTTPTNFAAASGDNTSDNISLSDGNPTTVYFFVKDAAGLTSVSSSASIIVDSTAPAVDQTLALSDTNSTAGFSQTATFNIGNVSYFTDGTGTGITHYYFTDNASVSASEIADSDWFAAADLANNLTQTLTNGSGNTPVEGNTLTLTLFAKDLLGNTASQIANIVYDNTAPSNGSSTLSLLYSADNSTHIILGSSSAKAGDQTKGIASLNTTTLTLSDGGSGVLGYVLNDNATAPDAVANFDNTTTFELNENTNYTLYLHAIDNAYNKRSITIGQVVYDTSSPLLNSISLSDAGGGADNATIVDVPGNTDDATINLSLSATDASGVQYVVISETALSNTDVRNSSSKQTNTNALSYTLTDTTTGYDNGTSLTLYVYAVDYADSITPGTESITIRNEASAPNPPTISNFELQGVDNATASAAYGGTYTDNNSSINFRFSASSLTTPISHYSLSCISTATNWVSVSASAMDITAQEYSSIGWPSNCTQSQDGLKPIYLKVKTQGGSESSTFNDNITLDSTAPVVSTFSVYGDNNTDDNVSINSVSGTAITWNLTSNDLNTTTFTDNTDTGAGVAYYIVSESSTAPTDSSDSRWVAGSTATVTDNLSNPTAGTTTLYAWVIDDAGNISAAGSDTILVYADTTAPTASASVLGSVNGGNLDNSTYSDNGTVEVTLTYSDADTEVSTLKWSSNLNSENGTLTLDNTSSTIENIQLSTDGLHTLTFTVTDAAVAPGNSATVTDNITVDTTDPTASSGYSLTLDDNDNYTSNTSWANDLTLVIDNNSNSAFAGDGTGGTGVTHYLLTDNASESASTISVTDARWFSASTISTDNLTQTFTMDSSSGAIASGDNLTLTLFAKDLIGNIGQIVRDSIGYDNVTPVNNDTDNDTWNDGNYDAANNRYTRDKDNITINISDFSDASSGLYGYKLDDSSTAPSTLAGYDNTSTYSGLVDATAKSLYLHLIDNAYNPTTISFTAYADLSFPSLAASGTPFTAQFAGADNNTYAMINSTDGDNISITFSLDTSGINGGVQGYAVVWDNATNASSLKGDYVNLTYSAPTTTSVGADNVTYSFDDSGSSNNDNLSFTIFAKSNAGKYDNVVINNIVLKDESGAAALGKGVSISSFAARGYDNASSTLGDSGTYDNDTTVTLKFTVDSDLTPLQSYAVSCADNSTGHFADTDNFDNFTGLNDNLTLTDYTLDVNLQTLTGVDCKVDYASSSDGMDGSKTIYFAVRTEGGTISSVSNDTIILDSTKPTISNFFLHKLDNASHTDNVTDNNVGYTINYNDLNGKSENGSLVAYYMIALDNTTPTASSTGWTAVDNASSSVDNYTFAVDNTVTSRELYVWVKDNATNVSLAGYDSIPVLYDSTLPVITSSPVTNNRTPDQRDATYANDDNVTIEIVAQDNESRVLAYLISESDNTTPLKDNSSWTAFSTVGNSVSENATAILSAGDGMKQLFVWVKNSMDNISLSGTDNITLDATLPSHTGTPRLTGTVTDNGTDVDNKTYTSSATVTIDNLTTWVTDATSGIATGQYYLSDNTTAPTLSSNWKNLDNLTFTIGSDWNGNGVIGNTTTLDNKTFYAWSKDNASNISDNYSMVTIFFDNVSPSFTSFSLEDQSDDNTSYTNSATVDLSLTDNDNGSGIMEYFYIESASAPTAPTYTSVASDYTKATGWTSSQSSWTFDNGTNEQKTVYVFSRDNAGNINTGSNASIVFDNSTPVIDNLTLAPAGFTFSGTPALPFDQSYASTATVALYLSANDNETNNFSSGWSEIKWSYTLTRSTQSGLSWTNTENWQSISDNISVTSDNLSFDNATWTLTLQNTNLYSYFDNTSTTTDNLSVTVYLRDNASNEVSYTSIFELDNSTIYYNQ